MADRDDKIERTTTEARAGATPGMTRYILAASMVLIIVAFYLIWALG